MESVASVVDALRSHGMRVTAQRACVVRHLVGNASHPTVEALFLAAQHDIPSISLKTVYQTVHDLETLGVVSVLDLGTGSVRVDPNVEHDHHHLVCTACHGVRDIPLDFDVAVDEHIRAGFRVTGVEVIVRGVCAACDATQPTA